MVVGTVKASAEWSTRWPERISYGLSDAADNLIFQMMTTYLLFFIWTFMIDAKVRWQFYLWWHGFVDGRKSFIIGIMIDHTHSKFGKSRTFFLVVFSSVCGICNFNLCDAQFFLWRQTYLGIRDLPWIRVSVYRR